MFKEGDIVKVIDFSSNYPNTPNEQLAFDHPYRRLGEGTCKVHDSYSRTHVNVTNLENDMKNSIYAWRCVLAEPAKPDWEV